MATTKTLYQRPAKTDATCIGEKNRTRWTRLFRKTFFTLIDPMEVLLAEETIATAYRKQQLKIGSPTWDIRTRWVTARIRTDQMAAIELLQRRHLKATGKEISKAEVLAALMASGLPATIDHEDFGGSAS